MGSPTKQCSKCGVEKELEDFHKNKRNASGLASWCKKCCAEANARRYTRDREKILEKRRAAYKRYYRENREEVLARERARPRPRWSELTPEQRERRKLQSWESKIRRHYNMTPERYAYLLRRQGGRCAVCRRRPEDVGNGRRLAVDHSHKCCAGRRTCGECVRGLVCYPCNTKIGYFEAEPERAARLIAYLEEHQPKNNGNSLA